MRRYSALRAPLLAFYSKALYRDVARNWRGSGVLYPLMLLAVCCVPVVVVAQLRAFTPLAARLAPIAEQLPTITISLGEVSVEATQPYVVKDARTGKAVVILDTTGQTTSLAGTEAKFLLTKTKLFIRQGADDVAAHDASDLPFRRVDREVAAGWLWWLKGPLALLLYPVLLLLSYVYVLAQDTVCGGFGLLVVRNRRWQFDYQTVMRLTGVAATPAVVAATVALVAGLSAPLLVWVIGCFALTMAYLCFAIQATTELRGSDLGASPDVPSFSIR
ncbi:MAG TPA: DUF1189 family protein [Planctomycetota bacterium]|nr:DUF1189 family protein [Planctomycetota bacterium]